MATRGRSKRRRRASSGSAVGVKKHSRSPRGANRGKSKVTVDSYRRGKPAKKR